MELANAGNVIIPAIKVIRSLGFSLRLDKQSGLFKAEKDGNSFRAEDPVAVLGLIKIHEIKGADWRVSDKELAAIGKEFDLL